MNAEVRPFHQFLQGEHAFYTPDDYAEKTKNDFQIKKLPVNYTWNTESTAMRVAKFVLSIILFPLIVGTLLHALIGLFVVPSTSSSEEPVGIRQAITAANLTQDAWKYKRFTVQCDGYEIDAAVMGKPETLGNGRFILSSIGNGEFYEDALESPGHDIKKIMTQINGNALIFNYPGAGASSGLPNRAAMAKAYRAMLHFLEDKEKGIGAREIIGYGHSIGGGVQAEALEAHTLDKSIKYVFVKSRSFSSISKTFAEMTNSPFLGFLVKLFGWNISSVESSLNLQAPEIILQTASIRNVERLVDSSTIIRDGVIGRDATLAKNILESEVPSKGKKIILGIRESHNESLRSATLTEVGDTIEALLDEQVLV